MMGSLGFRLEFWIVYAIAPKRARGKGLAPSNIRYVEVQSNEISAC